MHVALDAGDVNLVDTTPALGTVTSRWPCAAVVGPWSFRRGVDGILNEADHVMLMSGHTSQVK